MKKFIFLTKEGSTQDPHGEDVENLQVLGYGSGTDIDTAFENFKNENQHLAKLHFVEASAIELVNDHEYYLSF